MPAAGKPISWLLDFLSSEDIEGLLKGVGVYLRDGRAKFAPPDTAVLQQKAGRDAEDKRKNLANRSDVITPNDYEKFGIPFLNEFPAGKLDWSSNPHRLTLVDAMSRVARAFENAVSTSPNPADLIQSVRDAVERAVQAEYKDDEESEQARKSKLPARCGCFLPRSRMPASIEKSLKLVCGCFLMREMATRLE